MKDDLVKAAKNVYGRDEMRIFVTEADAIKATKATGTTFYQNAAGNFVERFDVPAKMEVLARGLVDNAQYEGGKKYAALTKDNFDQLMKVLVEQAGLDAVSNNFGGAAELGAFVGVGSLVGKVSGKEVSTIAPKGTGVLVETKRMARFTMAEVVSKCEKLGSLTIKRHRQITRLGEKTSMDQLAAMRTFRHVVQAGGFSAAADVLDVSHTVVSRQIRQLEALLGTQLLNRTTRRIALTEVGRIYYEHCVQILDQMEDAMLAVNQHQTHPAGLLRINAPMVFGTLELGRWLPRFMQMYPDLKVDLVCNDRFVDLITEEFDVGLRITRSLPDSTLIAKKLTVSEMVLVASPDYLSKHGVPQVPADLVYHNYLAYSLALQTTELSFEDAHGNIHTVNVSGNLQANTGIVVCDAAREGMGITASASFVVCQDLQHGRLVKVLPEYRLQARDLYVLYPQNRHISPKVRAFVDFITEYYAQVRWLH
ncbi:LysR family transcriptional regulator [Iodobacter arcticus]|uniref:LysR family transcriptional regulator n=1 Tax=Iodobacter arcticus TaxID=590593 RepID=A0ABW2R6L3_9NEIS